MDNDNTQKILNVLENIQEDIIDIKVEQKVTSNRLGQVETKVNNLETKVNNLGIKVEEIGENVKFLMREYEGIKELSHDILARVVGIENKANIKFEPGEYERYRSQYN